MANLLYAMLTQRGIKAFMTWIGTTELPYKYTELPHPGCSNHMIVTAKVGGRNYFLDATMRPVPFGLASIHIQGKEALISIDSTHYEIAEVPVTPGETNLLSDSVQLYIKDGQISGNGYNRTSSYLRYNLAGSLVEKNEKQRKEFLSNYLEKGNNKFEIHKFEVMNLDDRDKDILINYDFDLHEYMTKVEDELFVNMNLLRLKEDELMKDERKLPYVIRFGMDVHESVSLHIPDGYEVTSVPSDDQFDSKKFGFQMKYTSNDQLVMLTFRYIDNFILLEPSQYPEWNRMVNQLRKNYAETVTLKKKK